MSSRSDVVRLDACGVRLVDRERVAAVQEAMPSAEDVEQAADVFALLGDPNRLRLLVALLAGGEMCVCDLAASAGMSESAASHAVCWLRAHRIVSSPRRQGRMMYYRLEDAHVRMLLDLALTHTRHTQAVHPRTGRGMTGCGAGHPESGEREHAHAGAGGDHDHGGGHSHGVTEDSDGRYLVIALGLLIAFLVFEVIMAFAGHSLALLADAGHMLTDAGALAASLLAISLARRPASGSWTFGFKRAEVLSAQANGITLLVVSALVAFEAISRLLHPLPVRGGIVVTVAAVGVAVNVAATWVLARANRGSINVRGAFAHIITDLYGFTGTLAAGIGIIVTGFERADAIASLIVVGLMLHAAWGLLPETGRILLEAAPEGYAPADIIAAITARPEVASVHDVHVWLITSGFPALSAHVLVRPPADCHQVRRGLQQLLCDRFGLDHTTLQADHAPDELLSIGDNQR